jgi:hypothetical protein
VVAEGKGGLRRLARLLTRPKYGIGTRLSQSPHSLFVCWMPIFISNPADKSNATSVAPPDATAPIRPAMAVANVTTASTPPPLQSQARPPMPQLPIPPEASDTADELFTRLRRLCAEGRVAIDLDSKRLMHIDSPVSFEAWGNQWVYPLLLLTCLVWWFFGYRIGAGAAVASVLLYLTLGKAFLHRRIERRVREQVLEDVVRWRKLWSFGGVSLRSTANPSSGDVVCASPRDNWMEFVRQLTKA